MIGLNGNSFPQVQLPWPIYVTPEVKLNLSHGSWLLVIVYCNNAGNSLEYLTEARIYDVLIL